MLSLSLSLSVHQVGAIMGAKNLTGGNELDAGRMGTIKSDYNCHQAGDFLKQPALFAMKTRQSLLLLLLIVVGAKLICCS